MDHRDFCGDVYYGHCAPLPDDNFIGFLYVLHEINGSIHLGASLLITAWLNRWLNVGENLLMLPTTTEGGRSPVSKPTSCQMGA